MKKKLLFLTSALFSLSLISQPVINTINGIFQHKQSVTITGGSFGGKTVVPPLIWDDFENGTLGATVGNGWIQQRPENTYPIYTGQQNYGKGTQSLTNHVEPNINNAPGCQFCGAWQEVPKSNELYVSYQFRFDVTGNDYGILKLARLTSNPNYGGVDHYSGTGALEYVYQPQAKWGYSLINISPTNTIQKTMSKVPRGLWHRVEMYIKLSQPAGSSNGSAYVVIDNETNPGFYFKDTITLDVGYPTQLYSLLLPLMLANPKEDGKFDLYVDDVYLDNSLARVELGNSSTWSTSTHKEIQIPTSWTATGISITVNQGSFSDCEQVYLYVVDKDGKVNQNGYPVTIAGTGCITSVEKNMETNIQIYPNPTLGVLNIEGIFSTDKITLAMKNILGEEVKINHERFSNKIKINTEHLPAGVYFLNITQNNQESVHKIIKQD